MKLEALTKPAAPHLHLLIAPQAAASTALLALRQQSIAVRFVRGGKAATKQALLDELSAALQFPSYFGNNWDACADCLRDLSWLDHSGGIAVVFTDADRLLIDAGEPAFKTLLAVLTETAKHWDKTNAAKSSRPFHVVFQAEAENVQKLMQRFPGVASIG